MADYERRLDKLESLCSDRKVTSVFAAYEYADDGECVAVMLNGKHRTERLPGEAKDDLLKRAKIRAGFAGANTFRWKDAADA